MNIYVKRVEGIQLPFQATKKDKDGNFIPTNASAYDAICINDPKIVGSKYIPVPFEEKEVDNQWLRVDYVQYETGLFVQPGTQTHHLLIHPRSSNSDFNLLLANGIGLIDNDYRGQILVRYKYIWQPEDMWWGGEELPSTDGTRTFRKKCFGAVNMDKIYKKGDRVCQILIENSTKVTWEFVDDINQTVRGEGGFNSTEAQPAKPQTTMGKALADIYTSLGGVPVKERYTEEMKKRNQS